MFEKLLSPALNILEKALEDQNFLLFTIIITIAISFKLQTIYDFFQSLSRQRLQSLEEHITKDYLEPETRHVLQEEINSIIFKNATGIRAEKYKREQIVAIHKYAKGTLKYRTFQQAQIFLKMEDCSGHLKIRKIMFFEYFMYYFHFVSGIFLNFLAVVCFSLVVFNPLTVELQRLFILLTGFFAYSGFTVLSQTWPISAAKDIKKVIKNYHQEIDNQHLLPSLKQDGEVFDQATIEPVLITKHKRPSHVILSAEAYQQLITRLEELEDLNLGKAAETALTQSSMIGSKEFTAALEKIANG